MIFSLLKRSFSSSSSSSSSSSIQTLLKRGVIPTPKSINQFLLFLSKAHRYNLLARFFNQLEHNHIQGNSQTYTIFTWAVLKLGQFDEAELFIKAHLGKSPAFSNSYFWDALIRGFCLDKNDPGKAFQVLQDCLWNHGIVPSSFTFSSLIRSFSSRGDMSGAIDVLELMNDDKVKYPYCNFVCSSIISGFCRIRKPELALEFFENAVSVGALRPNLVTYTVLVSALCMLGRVREVWDVACKMEKEGLDLDVVFYSCWICGFLREGMLKEAFSRHWKMVNEGISLDTISYSILIDGFSKDGNVEKTVGFVNKMVENGLNPNLVTYTAIILGFCRKGKMEEAFALFKMVEELGIEKDEFIYAILIDGFCKAGDLGHAYQLLGEMEKKGIVPNIVTYNTMINGLCKVGRTSEANEMTKVIVGDAVTYTTLLHTYIEEENIVGILDINQRSQDSEVELDVVMCNLLIRGTFMVGAFGDTRALYDRMKEMGLVADSVTFCTMIDGYCKVGRIAEALEIFDESRRILLASASCYDSMICGLCKNSMVDVAREIFVELIEKDLTLDYRIYRKLIMDIVKAKGAKEVVNLICRIQNGRLDKSGTFCNIAIYALCKMNFLMAAYELLMTSKRNHSVLTSKSYYLVLKGLMNEGNIQLTLPLLSAFIKVYSLVEPKVSRILLHCLCLKDVKNGLYFLNKIKEKNPSITFPVGTLKVLARSGRALEAYNLFLEAIDRIPAMDLIGYTILVDGLCKEGHLVEALDLCTIAENKGIKLNIVTFNSVIHGLCLQGCLLEAFRLFDSLERIDLVPSEITYATLIDSLCRGGYLHDAEEFFKRMTIKGYEPNAHIYNSLISCYCKFGRMKDAFKILEDMEIKAIVPDEYTVSALIDGYCRMGNMEEALQFFLDCKRKGTFPDFLGFLCLIRGLCAKGRMEEARNILKEMLHCQPILELINRINVEDEPESVGTFLLYLCDQGSIKEAVIVLNEIGLMVLPVRKYPGLDHELHTQCKLSEFEELSAVLSTDIPSPKRPNESLKKLQCCNIDSCYSLVASLCSQGEFWEANMFVKEMLGNLGRQN